MPYTPTVRGRRLAQELRRLREEAGFTGEQAAERVHWDQSKISRIENARMRVTAGDVLELLEVYRVSPERREDLVRLAREARSRGWWHPYGDYLKEGFSQYLELESDAVTYRSYQAQLVPGLFQTAGYARAVFRARPSSDEEMQGGVELRMSRQRHITDRPRPLEVWQILEESALRRLVGSPEMMRDQLEHLLRLGDLPNVSLQALPYRAGVHAAIDGPFILLTFDGYPDVLYTEHIMGCVYLERPAETAKGGAVFDHLRAAALNTGDTAELIRQIQEEIR